MKTSNNLGVISSLSLLALSATPSSALVILISDLVPAGNPGSIESFLAANFSNVTEIRHANYANTTLQSTQDAINGTGAFAGNGAADVVFIGRSLGSGDYANNAAGYNSLTIPVINFTSYTARQDGNRMGWHASGATVGTSVAGAESTVTAAGALLFGVAAGTYDFMTEVSLTDSLFNGLAAGQVAFGGGQILATIGADTQSVYWPTGTSPGNTTAAGVALFPGPRLLFNLDNDPNAGNNGLNDFRNVNPAGQAALVNALTTITPLTAVPEPSTSLLGLAALSVLGLRRRR